jgi:hypothetical protein
MMGAASFSTVVGEAVPLKEADMFTAESSGLSVWDVLEDNPRFHERNPDPGISQPIGAELGFRVPYDVLLPRPELGPNTYTLTRQGTFIALSAMPKKPNGQMYKFDEMPRP